MRIRFLLAAACFLTGACGRPVDSSALRAGERAPATQATLVDLAVYEAMLEDSRAEFRKAYPEDRTQLGYAIDKQTSGSLFRLCVETLEAQLMDRPALYSELIGDLRRRNLNPDGKNGKPADLSKLDWKAENRVVTLKEFLTGGFMGGSEMRQKLPGVVSLFVFELPGYSRDGKFAVVFTWIGPTHIHSIHEVVLLEVQEGKWTVKWRQLAYFV